MPRTLVLWVLVGIGALCAVGALYSRVKMENATRGVDLAIDAQSLQDFCQSEGLDTHDTLLKLKQAGANAIAFPENTIDRLTSAGQVAPYSGADLLRFRRAHQDMGLPSGSDTAPIDPNRTYFVVNDANVLSDLQTYLPIFLGADRVHIWPSGASAHPKAVSADHPAVLEVGIAVRLLPQMGLGFAAGDIEAAHKNGLSVWLRPQNRPRFQAKDINEFLKVMAEQKKLGVRGLIFEGVNNDIVGYPDLLNVTVDAMRLHGLLYGDVEAPTVDAAQKGSQTLGKELADLTVRVFSLPALQQMKMTSDDALDRYRLGTRERNMRVLYLRLFTTPDADKTLLQTNLDYVSNLRETLARSGFTFDRGSQPFWMLVPKWPLLVGMALGAAALGLLFLQLFIRVPAWLFWLSMVGLPAMAAGGSLAHHWTFVSTLLALEVACATSVLGLGLGLPMLTRESLDAQSAGVALRKAILSLCMVTAVSLIGGLYMAGFMSGTVFMLSVSQFRGIKLIMVAGPAIVVLLWTTRFAPHLQSFSELLNRRVVFWHILAFVALAGAAAFYVIRTGNASPAAASDTERYVRNLLENYLVVRPRFKEFALGHPAWFVMAVLLWRRRGEVWTWLLTLAVAIGQVDVIDTFAHAHTPYMISLVRALLGLGLGIVVGLVAGWATARLVGPSDGEEAYDADPDDYGRQPAGNGVSVEPSLSR